MVLQHDRPESGDPHHLERFVREQERVYRNVLTELRGGRKRSHWMWFIFPQIDGLGISATTARFAIKSRAEAEAYLRHPVLGRRLKQCMELVLAIRGVPVEEIFGATDAMKLHSCATLFAAVSPDDQVFWRVLEHCFEGTRDFKTIRLLELADAP